MQDIGRLSKHAPHGAGGHSKPDEILRIERAQPQPVLIWTDSPRRISLPRKGCRVGLRIVLFEMLWGGGEEIAYIVADVTDGGPQCKSRTT